MILKDDFGVDYQLSVVNAYVDTTNNKMSTQLTLTPISGLQPSPGCLGLHDPGNTSGGVHVQDAMLSVKDLEQKNLMLEQKIFELEQKIDTILRMDEITKI